MIKGSSDNDPFLLLLGMSGEGNAFHPGNITGSVLQSLDVAFQDIIVTQKEEEEEPATGAPPHFQAGDASIPIFQDIHVILDDAGAINGSVLMVKVNGTPVTVDLATPTIIYNPGKCFYKVL